VVALPSGVETELNAANDIEIIYKFRRFLCKFIFNPQPLPFQRVTDKNQPHQQKIRQTKMSVFLPPPPAAYEVRTKFGSHQAPKSVIEGLALILRTRNGFGVRRVVSPSRNAENFFGGGT